MNQIGGKAKGFTLDSIPECAKARGYLSVTTAPVGNVELPILAAVGRKRAPILFVTAGVHGNEYEGQEAVRRFFDELSLDSLEGAFVGIPVCNVFAYSSGRRESPDYVDGSNLNRIFPGDPLGTPTQRLADALVHLVVSTLTPRDLFVDLHSAEKTYNLSPLAGYRAVSNASRERSESAARCLKGFHLHEMKHHRGMFDSEIVEKGIPSVGTEMTGGAGCEERDVALYLAALRSLAGFAGVAPFPYSVDSEAKSAVSVTVTAPESGFLRSRKNRRDQVIAGDLMGEIVSPIGEVMAEIRAPKCGVVWGNRRTPMVWAGETCFWIGVES